MLRFFHLLLSAAFLLLFAATSVQAQDPAAAQPSLVDTQQVAIEELAARADGLAKAVDEARNDDARLVDIRLELDDLSRAAIESGVAFRPRLNEINDRLTQLGPAPAEGQPAEPEIVAQERRSLGAEKAAINAVIGQAEQLSIRIGAAGDSIVMLRRDLFAHLLTRRYTIDYALLGEFASGFSGEMAGTWRSVSSWMSFVVQFKLRSVLAACFFALGAAAILLFGGRRVLGRLYRPDETLFEPSALSRLSVAFWATILPSMAFNVFLGATWFLFDYFQVLRGDMGALLRALFQVLAIVYFVHRLGSMALSPRLPQWRLIAVESHAATLLVVLVSVMALVTGLDYFLSAIFSLRGAPVLLTVGESLVASVLTGILVILVARVKPFAGPDGGAQPWPAWFRGLLYALGVLTVVPALMGYVGFARFNSRQVVVTGAALVTMGIGFLSARAVAEEGALAATRIGRGLKRRLKLSEAALDQLALVFSVTINLLVLLIGVPTILLQWGFQPGDLRVWAGNALSGFTIGTFHFSPVGVLSGVLLFAVGYALTRWFQRWLDGSVLARGRVDAGVRNSIRLVVGYAGYAIAGLIGISAAGINLSSLALVAGALSLGIGFGLQNIVSNFVSGLILLVERPFKVGDWIVAGAVTGTVKKISVRATEIETFQRQTMILPNSELINSAVGNWTHRNKLGRVDVKVNLAYGMDARAAHDAMLDVARGHPLVLKNPEPQAIFLNFGPAALEMELRVFLADILTQNTVQNDLRFAILETFNRLGLEMASAPRAVVELHRSVEAVTNPPEKNEGSEMAPHGRGT